MNARELLDWLIDKHAAGELVGVETVKVARGGAWEDAEGVRILESYGKPVLVIEGAE